MENNDVVVLTPNPVGSPNKKNLLDDFTKLFTKRTLFAKKGVAFEEVIPKTDQLRTTAYFITQKTLKDILAKMKSENDGLWIDLGYGSTNGRGKEIQLVLTVDTSVHPTKNDNIGKFCVTTAQIGNVVDPPFTGRPHPKDDE